jgi:hypothetical protein
MPFQVSPGVNISEIDLTTVVPAVSTTEGAFAGVFRWGPVDKVILIDTEDKLVDRFGKPTNHNAETFFTAANFLSYGNKLFIVRSANTTDTSGANGVLSAYANIGTVVSNTAVLVKNDDLISDNTVATSVAAEANVMYIARYPGELGNSLKISVCDNANAFLTTIPLRGATPDANLSANAVLTSVVANNGSNVVTVNIGQSGTGTIAEAVTRAGAVRALLSTGDLIEIGNSSIGTQFLKVSGFTAVTNTATVATFSINTASKYTLTSIGGSGANTDALTTGSLKRSWEFARVVDKAPGTSFYVSSFGNSSAVDEVHVVVADEDGLISGVPGTVLEVFEGLSRAADAKTEDGSSLFIKDVINQNSKYVYYANGRVAGTYTANGITANTIASTANAQPLSISFVNGRDGADEANVALSVLFSGYDKFKSSEDIDVSLILQGKSLGTTHANYLIDNIAETRKDCVAFISPEKNDVVAASGNEATNIVGYRNAITSTSYAVLDSGYKYQYDKYNDVYRFIPLNGDVAGLCVRTDDIRDPWFSPAGFNRGIIKNTIRLAYNPGKADRDILYKAGINPVVTFPGQGTILFGDKTLLARPSAFDRINVRRLFIVLEKAIATAAKFTLFEFNDEFTRAQFRNLVEPFLRDVQGRRGIIDFRVVCDETNNTGEVIDRNEFRGDIYIKPSRSINYIQLNFVAVRTGVEFSEIVGQF